MKWSLGIAVVCIITLALPLRPLYADWFHVISGDVHTNTLLDSNIPGNSEYFSISDNSSGLSIGDSGVITHDDASPDVGDGSETPDINGGSGDDWVFQSGSYPRTGNQYGYSYYFNLLTNRVPLPDNMLSGTCANMQSPGVYYQNTNSFTIDCPFPRVPLQQGKYTFLFSGDVTIRSHMQLQNQDDFVTVIAGGNIIIPDSMDPSTINDPALQGLYIADRQFQTESGDDDVYMEGIFIAWDSANTGQSFVLRRDDGNPDDAKEIFVHRPELLFSFPPELKRSNVSWEEVSP